MGAVREDGFICWGYNPKTDKPRWTSPAGFHRQKINVALQQARYRCRQTGMVCDLTIDHLLEIYPEDGLCPVLGFPMEWEGNRRTSPSLDRVVPEEGYIIGNMMWMSTLANRMKNDANPEELLNFAHYVINTYQE